MLVSSLREDRGEGEKKRQVNDDSGCEGVGTQGRGRALVASRAIKSGEILLFDSPLLLYPTSPLPSPPPLLPLLPSRFSNSSLSNWLRQTFEPDLRTQLKFLLAAASPSNFHHLLSLDGSEEPNNLLKAQALHSLVSSLPPSPLVSFSFSTHLTATTLAVKVIWRRSKKYTQPRKKFGLG